MIKNSYLSRPLQHLVVGAASAFVAVSASATIYMNSPTPDVTVTQTQLNGATVNGTFDASMSSYSAPGAPGYRYYIFPHVEPVNGSYYVRHGVSLGTVDDPHLYSLSKQYQWEITPTHPNNATAGGRRWINNTYEHALGTLAFVHVEHANHTNPAVIGNEGAGRIGVAYQSGNGGGTPTFEYLGHVIEPYLDPTPYNVHGTPYIIRNVGGVDYFYIYFHDNDNVGFPAAGHIGVARAPVSSVLAQAQQGQAQPWEKFHNGGFTPGLGGQSSPIGIFPVIAHGDAAYSTHANRYYMAGWLPHNFYAAGGNNPAEAVMYHSCDGLAWTEAFRFEQHNDPNVAVGYISISAIDGSDNAVVGEEMYVSLMYRYDDKVNPRHTEIRRYRMTTTDIFPCP